MRLRAPAAGLLIACALLAGPAGAGAAGGADVRVEFQDFAPDAVDVLPGETVTWTNVSERRHTVNADDGSFASGDLLSDERFSQTFTTAGTELYHCTVHPVMTGEIDVRRVILGPLPGVPVPAGDEVEFDGRTADPDLPISIQRVTPVGVQTIATGPANPDGTWKLTARASLSGDYRAATSAGVSGTRRLLVSDRKVLVHATRTGLTATVVPPLPYGRVGLQQYLKLHFGWWQRARGTLDYVSQARFRVRGPARVRVVLLDDDGWTALATSRVIVLRKRAGTSPGRP
jgi:plastocyanin